MKIVLKQCGEQEIVEKFNGTVEALLNKLEINPEAVLVVRNGELLAPDEQVSNDDHVEILSVVSGG